MRNVVLIAHEDPALVERYLDALDAAGFNCLTTHDGSGALATALNYSPALCILQVNLPEVQGTDVCLRLKQEVADLRVVLLGSDTPQERFVSNEVGANAFLAEPVDPETLVSTVKQTLV